MGIIGHGGAGIVLKAHDTRLNRYVALKVLLPALAHNSSARRRFERESRAVAAISDAHVIPIYAVDVFNDHPYLAMQYVGGTSLQQRIDRQGPLQIAEVVRIATKC
jgi:serine/threonine protein kinase